MIQGYGYGGWKNVVIRGMHHEHHLSVGAASYAVCIDSPDCGLILDDLALAGANITNKGGIWIKSSTNPRNIKIRNVYNDGDWSPILKDDFNSVTITSKLDRLDEYSVSPRVHAYNSGTQSLSNATWTAITLDTEWFDTEAMHSIASETSKVTIVTPGVYRIVGSIAYASNSTGLRYAGLRTGGSTYIASAVLSALTGEVTKLSVETVRYLAAGTYVELMGHQTSTGSLNSVVNDGAPALVLHLIP
jgi:hypothetical protein